MYLNILLGRHAASQVLRSTPLHSLHAIILPTPFPHKVSLLLPPLVYSCQETYFFIF